MLSFTTSSIAEEEAETYTETPITESDREHWSFQPLTRPKAPDVKRLDWANNPIDLFILSQLENRDVLPQPEADRRTLIRRVTLDLTGLPPTQPEIDAFLADDAPGAYERLVDRLLSSPALGEHYAQFWLDLARWAETDGFEHDKHRKEAWRYRDWVIEATNNDLPYDTFLSLQIAGDEIRPGDRWAQTATGFCLSGPDMPDINLKDERRHTVMNDITSTVGSVFMGLQFGCAQCHDHKYDPLSQGDFYRLRAFFEPAVDFSGHTLNEKTSHPAPSHFYIRGDFRRRGHEVEPDFPRVLNRWNAEVAEPASDAKSSLRRKQLAAWLTRPDHPLTPRVHANRLWQMHFGHGLSQTPGDFGIIGDAPYHEDLLNYLASELVGCDWSTKAIHRMIVTSATYRQASRPAEAGDVRFETALQKDPSNHFWSRFPRRRLSGEVLRDAMLATSGTLVMEAGGESVCPPLPKEVLQTLLRSDHWKVSRDEADHYRRSVYIFTRRNLRFPFFEAFDRPAAVASCPRRNSSTIAPQSLMLLNSEFSLLAARRLAGSTLAQHPHDHQEQQIQHIYRQVLGRTATDLELLEIDAFLQLRIQHSQEEKIAGDTLPLPMSKAIDPHAAAALVDFCLAMLNSSEFIYLE